MDMHLEKYEDNKLMKIIRRLKGIITKSQGMLDIDLSEYTKIDNRLKPAFNKYLNLLEKECKKIELNEKYFFDEILLDIGKEEIKMYLVTDDETKLNYNEFFKDNTLAKMYYDKANTTLYINEKQIILNGEIDELLAIKLISQAFEYYLYNKFSDREEKVQYDFLEKGLTELSTRRILGLEDPKHTSYVGYIKSAFRYRMLSGKSLDENKIFAEHKLGRRSYIYNILTKDFCENIQQVLNEKNKNSDVFTDKQFTLLVEEIYLKYVLDINKSKIRNIQKYNFANEYKRYYNIAKNLNVHSKNIDNKIIERILQDVSMYFVKNTEKEVDAIRAFLEFINTDLIYKSEFETTSKKLMLLIQILKIKSRYGSNVNKELEKILKKFKLVLAYKNNTYLEIEQLTGRFQEVVLKEVFESENKIKIESGFVLYTKSKFIFKDTNKYEKTTFLYNGTVKKEITDGDITIKEFDMQDELKRREYERLLKLTLTEYKQSKLEIEKLYADALNDFNAYFRRYILKYIPSSEYKMDEIHLVLNRKEYITKEEEQVNTVILKYFSKTTEKEFLEDEEANVKSLVNTFAKADKVFREN